VKELEVTKRVIIASRYLFTFKIR